MSRRLHYIDWLRVLAVLLLFPFHTSRVFNVAEPFYVKSSDLLLPLNYFIGFVNQWHMPLLFLLAGCSAALSFAKRSNGEFLRERLLRLGVPLAFGILVLMVPQTWVGAQYNSGSTQSIWRYVTSLDFLRWNVREGGDYYGGFGVGHLWFVLFLLVFSLLVLALRWRVIAARMDAWARALARPLWWFLPPLLLWFTEGLPDFFGKKILYFLTLYVLGYIVISAAEFAEKAERLRYPALAAGILLSASYTVLTPWRDSLPDPSWALFFVNYAGMFGVWTMLVGLLGMGRRWLDRPSATLAYLAEGSYPIYLLHQTAIVVIAWYVAQLPIAGALQWALVFAGSAAASFAIYEIVRRVSAMRFLFGMRPQRA